MNFKLIFVEGDSEEMFTKNAFEEFKSIYPNVEIVLLKDSEISEFNNMDISQADNSLWPTAYYHQFWHSANEDNYVSKKQIKKNRCRCRNSRSDRIKRILRR